MKYSTTSVLSAALLVGNVAAFPRAAMDSLTAPLLKEFMQPAEIARRQAGDAPQGEGALPSTPPPFDAAAQLIDVTGAHAFVAPTASDARGVCPGLNALANHGYLPHNGIATIAQFVQATTTVFGMGEDLATFLAVYGAIVDGDGTGWSIGGKPHTGIGGSHGNYETDSSPFKSDLYQYGSSGKLVISQFQNVSRAFGLEFEKVVTDADGSCSFTTVNQPRHPPTTTWKFSAISEATVSRNLLPRYVSSSQRDPQAFMNQC
nr:aromatic peroxygenase [Quercus suber]